MLERAQQNPKIKWITNAVVDEVFDVEKGHVNAVQLRDVKTGRTWRQPVDGLFLAIGHVPNTAAFRGQIELDADGFVISKGGARTSVHGVFHAGDVQDRVYRQAVTAAGAGCMAAIEVERLLEAEGH
jgi:thioredoxin reductase (NADPH)